MNEVRYRAAEARLWASEGVRPAERRVRLATYGEEVRVQEAGEGPPILFIHGATTCGTSWASLVARLGGFRCLLVDRPGAGLSDPLRPPVTDIGGLVGLADSLVPDILDGLGIESAHIVATSFGGYFAMRAALTHPERVRRIVIFGWTAGAPLGRLPAAMRVGGTPVLGELLARMPVNDRMVRSMMGRIGLQGAIESGRVSDEAVSSYGALLRHTPTLRNELSLSRAILSPVTGLDPRLLLSADVRARIGAPILFVWGEDDPYGGAAIAREFVQPFPDARLEIVPRTGHAVWMDDADHAAASVGQFLDS